MRSPHGHVGSYWDPIDDSAIYSLQTIGRERLAAGSAQNCAVKFFDLRVSGGRAYHYLDVQQGGLKFKGHPNPSLRHAETKLAERRGWNLFLSPRTGSSHFQNQLRLGRGRNAAARELRRLAESPIYSLCNPSPSSPTLFAGLENFIAQVDITCMTDKHPDPLFSNDIVRYSNSGDIDPIATWDRDGDVVDLAMYEHSLKGGIDLKVQVKLGDRGNQEGVVNGLDERWRERPKWRS